MSEEYYAKCGSDTSKTFDFRTELMFFMFFPTPFPESNFGGSGQSNVKAPTYAQKLDVLYTLGPRRSQNLALERHVRQK